MIGSRIWKFEICQQTMHPFPCFSIFSFFIFVPWKWRKDSVTWGFSLAFITFFHGKTDLKKDRKGTRKFKKKKKLPSFLFPQKIVRKTFSPFSSSRDRSTRIRMNSSPFPSFLASPSSPNKPRISQKRPKSCANSRYNPFPASNSQTNQPLS